MGIKRSVDIQPSLTPGSSGAEQLTRLSLCRLTPQTRHPFLPRRRRLYCGSRTSALFRSLPPSTSCATWTGLTLAMLRSSMRQHTMVSITLLLLRVPIFHDLEYSRMQHFRIHSWTNVALRPHVRDWHVELPVHDSAYDLSGSLRFVRGAIKWFVLLFYPP